MSIKNKYAIVGLGVTPQGKVPGISAAGFEVMATHLAIQDAGLRKEDIGGYIAQGGMYDRSADDAVRQAGLKPKFHWVMQAGGTTAISSIIAATGAIEAGLANYVVCVYGRNALSMRRIPGAGGEGGGMRSTFGAYGLFGPGSYHALAARRHMHEFGTTSRQLGAIAVTEREYANKRPEAYMYSKPMTIEDHQNSRIIADPLHLFDFCLVTDGGVAVIVTTAERAKALKRPPVYIMGVGLGHQVKQNYEKAQFTTLAIAEAKEAAFKMAGIELKDIDVAELYDCFTITVLLELEGYGFCKRGEGGPYVEAGNMRLDGACPTNTGGGELSSWYCEGFTALTEAIRQLRGEGGATQVKDAEIALVSGHGGFSPGPMNWSHATAILRRG